MNCPKCSTCGQPMLAFAASYVESYVGLWCPACEQLGMRGPSTNPPKPTIPDTLKAHHTGVPYEARVERDGSVTFTMRLPDRELYWRATAEEIRGMASGLGYVFSEALRQLERLTGADRWSFEERAEGVFASIHKETRELEQFRVGKRHHDRAAFLCGACHGSLVPGAVAYRPKDPRSTGYVEWRECRFCAGCVVQAKPVAGTPVLRSIDGGLSRKKAAS